MARRGYVVVAFAGLHWLDQVSPPTLRLNIKTCLTVRTRCRIDGVTPPLFPSIVDYRGQRFLGCTGLDECVPIEAIDGSVPGHRAQCCPWGETFWSSMQFRVSNAKGGAVSANGPTIVTIRDTQFQVNEADRGASISLSSTITAHITNTTIDIPVDEWSTAVETFGTKVGELIFVRAS